MHLNKFMYKTRRRLVGYIQSFE